MKDHIRQRWLQGLAIAAGVALAIIGLRFGLVPRSAARFFGIDASASPAHLHYVIALRDVWLGLLLIVIALLHDWRSMAIWLAFGAAVCFADAVIVANATAWTGPLLFHVMSGIYCAVLAIMCWGEARRVASLPKL
jgi:uncharacterized membrane protein